MKPTRIFIFIIALILLWMNAGVRQDIFAQSSIQLALDSVVGGFDKPVYVTHAGDGSGRLFIVEQVGKIRIFQNGSLMSTPFLDIQSLVSCCGEKGLLSVAFHPNYKNNRRFFVNYTADRPNLETIIAEYQTSSSDPNIAETSERVILQIDQPFSNHNGGQLQFGPDGYLYIGMGDGGSGGDPQNNAQDKNKLLGKLLRIDIDQATPYAVPSDNPFASGGGRGEIWAYGLRNPWRFSFDRANGRLFVADVGQDAWEEVDIIEKGKNYGWRIIEGSHCFNPSSNCNTTGLALPIDEYDHGLGESITGGYVYRGTQFPELNGTYIFGDYISSRIWGLSETSRGTWSRTQYLSSGFNISSFGEDEDGEIYVVNYSGGKIHRIRVSNPQPSSEQLTLVPSTAKSDRFTSSFVVINRGKQQNQITITAHGLTGSTTATKDITLSPEGFYQTNDVLGALGLPLGSFGPVTVESNSDLGLTIVSEVRSATGTAGFLAGKKKAETSKNRIIPEAVDTGDKGAAGTFRTNLGLNNLSSSPANVQVSFYNSAGSLRGSGSFSISPQGMTQVDGIVRRILGSASATGLNGYLKLVSDQPIHGWASKIDNLTDDPSLEAALTQDISDSSTSLLIPSVVTSDRFQSSLVVINTENKGVPIVCTARTVNGAQAATLSKNLPAGGFFRSLDILTEMGLPQGSYGPLTIETTSDAALMAISEVRSSAGTAGFFPAASFSSSTLERTVAEVLDTGDRGTIGTYRTNLGLNNLGFATANVTLQLIGSAGNVAGSITTTVPKNGLKQLDNVVRLILGTSSATGVRGYIKIQSDQPIHAWASKIDNGTDDPSIIIGVP